VLDKKRFKTLNYFYVSLKNHFSHKKKKDDTKLKEREERRRRNERGRSAARDLRFRSLLSFLKRAAYTNNNNNNTSAFSIVVVVVVVHAHTERKSFPKTLLSRGKKETAAAGDLENRNERARGFSLFVT